jgi:hypothetical protein
MKELKETEMTKVLRYAFNPLNSNNKRTSLRITSQLVKLHSSRERKRGLGRKKLLTLGRTTPSANLLKITV